jgi:pyruvate/2-oxoglutarate dehydrogenase complex dihydrolipoamide acyltransferase (E2) component
MNILEEIIIPQESVNDDKVFIVELTYKNGDAVKKGDVVIEIETSKSTLTIETQSDGFIEYYCTEGDEVNIGSVASKIFDKYEQKNEELLIDKKEIPKDGNYSNTLAFETIFSKKAKQLIEKNKLKADEFQNKDFVNERDVKLFLNPNSIDKPSNEVLQKTTHKVVINNRDNVHIEKLSSQKLREIEYLSAVQQYGLNSSISVVADFENVIPFVSNNLSILKGSFLPIVTYELARLLRKFPKLNAYYENEAIVYYDDINIGIAIDMDNGLKVLKIAETETLSMVNLEESILSISKKYIENKVTPDDSSNITFTITDLSNEGVSIFLPLINKANSAILAISSLDKFNGVTFTITFDHRVTEGKYIAEFLKELKNRIESYGLKSDSLQNKLEQTDIRCHMCHRKLSDNLHGSISFLKVIDLNEEDKVLCSLCLSGY